MAESAGVAAAPRVEARLVTRTGSRPWPRCSICRGADGSGLLAPIEAHYKALKAAK